MTISKIHQLFLKSKGISTDTRKIEPHSIFFALKGENFDGNSFALQALEQGANFAVVEKMYEPHENIIEVADVLKSLQQLANFHRNYLKLPVIGVTGSNGKTTTKELVHAVLSRKYKTLATKGNLNNHIGVPLTLLSMTNETEMGIVEMGANHPGEIGALCEIAQPDYGYITNFGKAHLEGFGGIAGVIKSKSELYDFLKKHHKTIFVNSDDEIQNRQSAGATTYQFGENGNMDCEVSFLEANPFVEVSFQGKPIKSQLIGKYNTKNISAAIGIGNYFGVEFSDIKEAIEKYVPENNRSQILEQNGNHIILDAYNANPTSMAAALESFDTLRADRKILVLGDMFEVGKTSAEEHQAIVDLLENIEFEKAYLCGKEFFQTKSRSGKMEHLVDFKSLKKEIEDDSPISGAYILVKGSRGMKLERVLEFL